MHKQFFKYRREAISALVIFMILQLSQLDYVLQIWQSYVGITLVGVLYLTLVSLFTYRYSPERVNKKIKTQVLLQQIGRRLNLYIVMPIILYGSSAIFLYFNQSNLLKELTVILLSLTYFINWVAIRISFEQQHALNRNTVALFSFVDILTFFMVIASVFLIVEDMGWQLALVAAVTAFILAHQIKVHNQLSLPALLFIILSTVLVVLSAYFATHLSLFRGLIVQTIAFYFVTSILGLKLSGNIRYQEYFTPFLFSVIMLIIIFSF